MHSALIDLSVADSVTFPLKKEHSLDIHHEYF